MPIIALAGMLTNTGRVIAFCKHVDWRRALIVLVGAMPPCVITAYGYTLLTGKGAQLVIGAMLMLTVPLRYALRRRGHRAAATAGCCSARSATARRSAARSARA